MTKPVTTAYTTLLSSGKMRDANPEHFPAGKSQIQLGEDSTARDVEPDTYFPQPPTPTNIRKYRKNYVPGEIITHFGLKDQRLPGEDFKFGAKSLGGDSVAQILEEAAKKTRGIAEYKNAVAEQVYLSTKREPLGRSYDRGHGLPKQCTAPGFRGFGTCSDKSEDAKLAIYPRGIEPDSLEIRQRYLFTHGSIAPGEMFVRDYNWPEETKKDTFRFGIADRPENEPSGGEGAKNAINMEVEDDGHVKKTVLISKRADDQRWRQNDQLGKTRPLVYRYPPVPEGFKFGITSKFSDSTAKECVRGDYSEEDQLPDLDLGKCITVGRRNITDGIRSYGTPSVRNDIQPPPPEKRSLADNQNYGDEAGTGPLLNPTMFESMSIPKDSFAQEKGKDELRNILKCAKFEYADPYYDALWNAAVQCYHGDNAEGAQTTSVDAFLAVTKECIEIDISRQLDDLRTE